MRLIRFLRRAFHDGRLFEPGEEVVVEDTLPLGAHMMDVATGLSGDQVPPQRPVFRAELAQDPEAAPPAAPEAAS